MGLWLRENVVDGKGVAVDGDDRYRSLADIDVTRDQSSAWQSIAWIPEALFESKIEDDSAPLRPWFLRNIQIHAFLTLQ